MTSQQRQPFNPLPGDQVRILGRSEIFRVTNVDDPALVTLESKTGQTFRAGRKALELVARESAA